MARETQTAIGPGLWLNVVKDDDEQDMAVTIRIDLPFNQTREISLDLRDMDTVADFWLARRAKQKRSRRSGGDGA